MPVNQILSLKDLCSLLTASIPHSAASLLWSIITFLWPWYFLLILATMAGWIAFELNTRNGTAHYNSENGFSPIFNSFVGSGVYLGLQTLVYFLLKFIFGDGIYCFSWPYVLHAIVFASTGLLLHLSGFWPYLVEPGQRRRRNRRRKNY